ncbi:MAG: hypothetical protein C5B46_06755 [Proteobacteria bacterium]|nr:MAG: hypothetical protein C5B46_06755 [Pseudomonadota bacterium]
MNGFRLQRLESLDSVGPRFLGLEFPRLALVVASLIFAAPLLAAETGKSDKIDELVSLHDLKTAVAIGDYYLRQRTLFAIRDRLAEIGRRQGLGPDWNPDDVHWKQAEAALFAPAAKQLDHGFSDLEWLSVEWAQLDDRDFSERDIDQLLAHFKTQYGRKQVMIVDHGVAVHVQSALTFTGKMLYDVPGLEAERDRMQHLYNQEDTDMRFNFQDSPEGQQFALSPVGKRYFVNAMLKVSGMISKRLDDTAAGIPQMVDSLSGRAEPAVQAFRRYHQG